MEAYHYPQDDDEELTGLQLLYVSTILGRRLRNVAYGHLPHVHLPYILNDEELMGLQSLYVSAVLSGHL